MITKRRSNFFDVYIVKLLKNISEKAEISRDTRNQLNMIIQIFCQKIVDIVYSLLKNTKKRTINVNTVENAIDIFLYGELKKNAKKISYDVINNKFNLIKFSFFFINFNVWSIQGRQTHFSIDS